MSDGWSEGEEVRGTEDGQSTFVAATVGGDERGSARMRSEGCHRAGRDGRALAVWA